MRFPKRLRKIFQSLSAYGSMHASMGKRIYQMMPTYNDKDGLKDGTSLVPPPVGLTKEGTKQREKVDRPCPFANIVSSISIVLTQNSCQIQNQVHSYSEECQCSQPLIHCDNYFPTQTKNIVSFAIFKLLIVQLY